MKVVTCALCKEVLFDKFTNTFSFIHILEQVRPRQYPFILSDVSIGLLMEFEAPTSSLSLQVSCLGAGSPGARVAGFGLRNLEAGIQKLHLRLHEITLVKPGRYDFQITAHDGMHQGLVASLPLLAVGPMPSEGKRSLE